MQTAAGVCDFAAFTIYGRKQTIKHLQRPVGSSGLLGNIM